MERWSGRVALVTGASAGIGAAITKELVLKGMKVVGVARRLDRIEAMKTELQSASGQLYPMKCDVTQENDILAVFDWVNKNLGGVDVLVNNAGVGRAGDNLMDGPTSSWLEIIQTNLLGLSICTREAIKAMRARGLDDGHIIHINSVAGHDVVNFPGFAMYTASKHGVTALTESLRLELVRLKSRIRVTSISPGLVKTEIFTAAGQQELADSFGNTPILEPKDVADGVLYALGAPPHVQIHELTMRPV